MGFFIFRSKRRLRAMKALLALFLVAIASRAVAHNHKLRANQFDDERAFSPYLAMLPRF